LRGLMATAVSRRHTTLHAVPPALLCLPSHRGTEQLEIEKILEARGRTFVRDERLSPDDANGHPADGHSNRPSRCSSEGHAADAREDVDAARLSSKHPNPPRAREHAHWGSDAAESELSECSSELFGVFSRRLDEHVEVFGEPRLCVNGDCVTPNQEESGFRGDQCKQELAPVVVQAQNPRTTPGEAFRRPRAALSVSFLRGRCDRRRRFLRGSRPG